MSHDLLGFYRERRRSRASRRAASDRRGPRPSAVSRVFVVYEHDVSPMYYDFRLEIDGVLKCWRVPEEPSADPQDTRLAVEAEDQPLDYADFEGLVPKSACGGAATVWDIGFYDNAERAPHGSTADPLSESWAGGHLTVTLCGKKLSGRYALTHFLTEDGKRRWLLTRIEHEEPGAHCNVLSITDHLA